MPEQKAGTEQKEATSAKRVYSSWKISFGGINWTQDTLFKSTWKTPSQHS